MASSHPLLIVGNWKMNPESLTSARQLFIDIRGAIAKKKLAPTVAIAPPTPFLTEIGKLSPSKRISLVAQTVSVNQSGAHTGESSVSMLKSVGVASVIIGHSERRASGVTDEMVVAKTIAVLKAGMTAIVCVGEKERDTHGHYFTTVETQLQAVLKGLSKASLSRLVVAYEPIWAIGTGNTATAEDAHEMKLFIQKIIATVCGRANVKKVRILYGGSVTDKNAAQLLVDGEVDGFLIGGSSLKATTFANIVTIAHAHTTHGT